MPCLSLFFDKKRKSGFVEELKLSKIDALQGNCSGCALLAYILLQCIASFFAIRLLRFLGVFLPWRQSYYRLT
jgi:hypothetical protein